MREIVFSNIDTALLNRNFCKQAFAYLMPSLPNAEGAIQLSELESPVISDLHNGLLIGYLVYQDNHFTYVQTKHMVSAGLDEAALRQTAIGNLEVFVEKKGVKVQPYGDTFAIIAGGNFEASLTLVDKLWDVHLAHMAPNGFMIAIPARDILAFCDRKSETGIE